MILLIKKIAWLLGLCLINTAYANNWDYSLSGGATFSRLVNPTIVQITPLVTNNYVTQFSTQTGPFIGLGVAHVCNNLTYDDGMPLDFSYSLGVSGYYVHLGDVKGIQYPFVNGGSFDTLDYTFKVQSSVAMFESRFFYHWDEWRPYVFAGLGSAWNQFHDYRESPTIPELGAAPVPNAFGNHTKVSFSYELGLGIQHALYATEDLIFSFSVDYRYLNLGKGELGIFPGQAAGVSRLGVSNLNTQGVLLGLHLAV